MLVNKTRLAGFRNLRAATASFLSRSRSRIYTGRRAKEWLEVAPGAISSGCPREQADTADPERYCQDAVECVCVRGCGGPERKQNSASSKLHAARTNGSWAHTHSHAENNFICFALAKFPVPRGVNGAKTWPCRGIFGTVLVLMARQLRILCPQSVRECRKRQDENSWKSNFEPKCVENERNKKHFATLGFYSKFVSPNEWEIIFQFSNLRI